MKKRSLSLSVVSFVACFSAVSAFAHKSPNQNLSVFELRPAGEIAAFGGDKFVVEAQGMMPIHGNQKGVFYALGEGAIGKVNNGRMFGLGAGYRQVVDADIYGGYFLVDYNKSSGFNEFWNLNPGAEILGSDWDARANLYIPLKRRLAVGDGKEHWADTIGIYGLYKPEGAHQVSDEKFKIYEETGFGGDLEVAKELPFLKNVKLHVGGYYFATPDFGNIKGAEGRVVWNFHPRVSFEFKDSYDNRQHNTALLGVNIRLGGFDENEKSKFGISSRLLDPIEHNLATPGQAYAPGIVKQIDMGRSIEYTNVIHFTPNPQQQSDILVAGDGTWFNPYKGINQDTLDKIFADFHGAQDVYFWFAGGPNAVYDFSSMANNRMSLPGGYHVRGFSSSSYLYPANGGDRPLFIGGIDLGGSYVLSDRDNNALEDIRLESGGFLVTDPIQPPYGVQIGSLSGDRVSNILINDIAIGFDLNSIVPNGFGGNFYGGMAIGNADNVVINRSSIYGNGYPASLIDNGNGIDPNISGISVNNSTVNIGDNNIIKGTIIGGNINNGGVDESVYIGAAGISAVNNATVIVGSGNTISGYYYSQSIPSIWNASSAGVSLMNSNLVVQGNGNRFIGTWVGHGYDSVGESKFGTAGIAAQNSNKDLYKITINGSNNEISSHMEYTAQHGAYDNAFGADQEESIDFYGSTGIYASGTTIDLYGAGNVIKGLVDIYYSAPPTDSAKVNFSADEYSGIFAASGVFLLDSAFNIHSSSFGNTIDSNMNALEGIENTYAFGATGIIGINSSIQIDSDNNIIQAKYRTNDFPHSFGFAGGSGMIGLGNTNISISGNYNLVRGTVEYYPESEEVVSKDEIPNIGGIGISLLGVEEGSVGQLNVSGSNNTIQGTFNDTRGSSKYIGASGITAAGYNTQVTVSGTNNTIWGEAIGTTESQQGEISGITLYGAGTVNVTGGTIKATTNRQGSSVYGIYVSGSDNNIVVTATNTIFDVSHTGLSGGEADDVSGNRAYGIRYEEVYPTSSNLILSGNTFNVNSSNEHLAWGIYGSDISESDATTWINNNSFSGNLSSGFPSDDHRVKRPEMP